MGFSTYDTLFDKCVLPVLNYGAEIWGGKDYSQNQQIQNRAMRFYLGVHKFAPTLGMFGDLGWIPVKYSQFLCMLRFWNRLVTCPQDRLLYKIFQWDYDKCNKNWCRDIRNIFEQLDMLHVYEGKIICNLNEAKTKFTKLYKDQWKNNITDKVKLRTYNRFKTSHDLEEYVKLNLSRSDRSLLVQLRLGILPIHIETGRFRRIKPDERICPLCFNGVEDEHHFIFTCPLYDDLRKELFNIAKVGNRF